MDERVAKSKVAERLLTRPGGATMREIIAATGGPQYNELKRLSARGYAIRKVKEGNETRYFATAPESVVRGDRYREGAVTIPRRSATGCGFMPGTRCDFPSKTQPRRDGTVVQSDRRDLGKPKRSATLEEMDEAIRQAAVDSIFARSARNDDRIGHEHSRSFAGRGRRRPDGAGKAFHRQPLYAGMRRGSSIVSCSPNLSGFSRASIASTAPRIAAAIESMIAEPGSRRRDHDDVSASARRNSESTSIDFTDAMIGRINRARGCEATATFDRKAARLEAIHSRILRACSVPSDHAPDSLHRSHFCGEPVSTSPENAWPCAAAPLCAPPALRQMAPLQKPRARPSRQSEET